MGIIGVLVRRRVLVTVLVLIAVILGAISYASLGLRRFPDIDFPFATISTVMPGGNPVDIEADITRRIEDAVSSISGIDELTSYSQQGLSLVLVQFDLEEDIDIKATDISNKLDLVRRDLPDAAEDPVVSKFDITQMPIVQLALHGQQGANELYRLADEELETFLAQVPGVAQVELAGGEEREIQVLLDARKLRKHAVSIGSVVAALKASNLDVPAGHVTQTDREVLVRTTGRLREVGDIGSVRVPTGGGGTITVADLGQVVDTYGEARSCSRFDGEPAIIIGILSQSGANEVEVADRVKERLPELRRLLPDGASLDIATDDSEFIRGALANVRTNMLIGILLTAFTLFLFLKSGRATAVVAVVMPAAIIATFTWMLFSGFTLNILTLTGLAITVGVLVNNAILIVENVIRFIHDGHTPQEAAVLGTNDIALAIISSTATNLVVFIPLAFMGEIIGRFFKELGLTVVYATVVSLLVSFSLTPMMCGALLKGEGERDGWLARVLNVLFGWTSDVWQAGFRLARAGYLGLLDWCLVHRALTVTVTVLAVVASLGVFAAVGGEFQPAMDEGRVSVTVQTPVGTPLAGTDSVVRLVEDQVREMSHLEHYSVRVGKVSGFLGGSSEGVNLAEVVATVADRADRQESLDDLVTMITPGLAEIPGAQIAASRGGSGPGLTPIEVQVSGKDMDEIRSVAEEVMGIVERTRGTAGVAKSYQTGQPEMRVVPRPEAGRLYKIDNSLIAGEVRSYLEGTVATQFRDRGENYDILVKLRPEDRRWEEDVDRMFISSPVTGQMIRIGNVARLVREAGPTLITRKDRRRLITVTSQLTGELPSGKVKNAVETEIGRELRPPEGVLVEFGGETEMMEKNFRELFKAMAIAAVLTFLCVAGIIESFLFAGVIIAALPVSLVGVAVAMLLGNVTVNMFSLMAMVILVGMVVNNAIIVVDKAMGLEREGQSPHEAIRGACALRFRMIIMANLTTMIALVPLSLGLGFGGEIFRPLAVVEIGGIFAAGALSLLVIPAVYLMLRGRRQRTVDS